jgi:hypothetical protein
MWAVHAVQERLARFWQQIGVVDAVRARDQLGEQRLGAELGAGLDNTPGYEKYLV